MLIKSRVFNEDEEKFGQTLDNFSTDLNYKMNRKAGKTMGPLFVKKETETDDCNFSSPVTLLKRLRNSQS